MKEYAGIASNVLLVPLMGGRLGAALEVIVLTMEPTYGYTAEGKVGRQRQMESMRFHIGSIDAIDALIEQVCIARDAMVNLEDASNDPRFPFADQLE